MKKLLLAILIATFGSCSWPSFALDVTVKDVSLFDRTQTNTVNVTTSPTDIITVITGLYGWEQMTCEIDNATNALTAFTTHVTATASSTVSAAVATAAADYTTAPKPVVRQCEASPVTLGASTKTTCIFNTGGVYSFTFRGTKATAGNTTMRCYGN